MEFVKYVREIGLSKTTGTHNDDVFVDRINYKYTVTILVIFSIVITATQYGLTGSPIQCWVPGHFNGNYEKYAERICWVSNTYNIPMNEDIPHEEPNRKSKMLKYYQWTPFILLFQALLFYLPRMIWRSMNDKSGLDLEGLIEIVHKYEGDPSKSEERKKLLNYVARTIDHYVSSAKRENCSISHLMSDTEESDNSTSVRRRNTNNDNNTSENKGAKVIELRTDIEDEDDETLTINEKSGRNKMKSFFRSSTRVMNTCCITRGKRYGNFLLVLFIFVKLLYTINSIIQLFILNQFLGNDYLLLGVEVFKKIWFGEDWSQIKRFPRVTLCDFHIREVGIVHRYTVQCVLSVNLFNEKIFIFIWYWLCLVSIFNILDLFTWSYRLVLNSHERYMYIKRRVGSLDLPDPKLTSSRSYSTQEKVQNKKLFIKFVNNYLKEDGVLALRLLARNAQDLIVSEVITKLYELYKNKEKKQLEEKNDEEIQQLQSSSFK